jgi:hypothetical protein
VRVAVDYQGEELIAEKQEDGDWLVRLGDRSARARYLDYALAELLRVPPGEAIPLATRIVEQLPADSSDERE